ncbi:MAG: extracellular solute-binding protein [Candidatus Izemoplasmatales bacterium]|nr:extracellular solute-binding protein [Candidatus Izemoplasmatales bacterium]
MAGNRAIVKKIIIASIFIVAIIMLLIGNRNENIDYLEFSTEMNLDDDYAINKYVQIKNNYSANNATESIVFTADTVFNDVISGDGYGYFQPLGNLQTNEEISFNVNLPEAGLYNIEIDFLDVSPTILPSEVSLRVNDGLPFEESRAIKLSALWEFESTEFIIDRYGNEVMPSSVKVDSVQTTRLFDTTGLNQEPLIYQLNAGNNEITLKMISGDIFIGTIRLVPPRELATYDEYLNLHQGDLQAEQIIISASELKYKNTPSIRLRSEADPAAVVYDTRSMQLNAIDGYSFRNGDSTITYEITVPETGYYNLGIKYRQDYMMQMPVFRELSIDGEIPFEEASMLAFHYTKEYRNLLFQNEEPFMFYFEAGTHEISLRVVLEPYRDAYETLIGIMEEITDLSLEIKKLTGNNPDQYRTWKLVDYIPDIEDRMDKWLSLLNQVSEHLKTYSHHDNPGVLTNINLAKDQLEKLREDVDLIPSKMLLLADGNTSAAQMLGSIIQTFLQNGLDVQTIYLTGEEDLPKPKANIFVRSSESIKRFFLSFSKTNYQVTESTSGVIDVWVNHPRQYIEIMQLMVDSDFTENTGIQVQLSLMPDENKLILANAAGNAPDVALGVNHWIPYEFAIRGASLDLRSFDGYEETVGLFAKGALIPYAFEDGMFGIPETQNFWVTFYREDIYIDGLGLEVPDTWDEVIEILPQLQRYGMNYYEPLALFRGFKPFVATMPFIYQFDGRLYSEDGISTEINSEESLAGMRLMTDLFTVYNMPKEIPNFYQHFRYGTLPIGISDLATYLQLTIAAPEIAGKWNIALHPGVEKEGGEVVRWAASGAQASMILSNTDQPEDAWKFLQWWMSTEIQSQFAMRLQTTYGFEYLWNTANLEAFAELPLPQEHINVILAQWEYALEASRIPGAYMVEREISNAWNTIVFDDENPRIALDEAAKTSNREILYKMEEFGYVVDGVVVKDYKVPTIYNIDDWLVGRDNND